MLKKYIIIMSKKGFRLYQGDNIESLKKLPDNSIDSIVSDPPYGISFMNRKWDYDVPSVDFWKEVYRVLKPGGHVLSFGGTRTYHRMVVNIEDAGFEIRDQIMWLYAQGFPKSLNIGKAVDKLQGNDREVVGVSNNINFDNKKEGDKSFYDNAWASSDISRKDIEITKGQSPYEGWGTALKPANEPICVARKPLSEKSVAENVLKWGTGGINIDGCRVGTEIITGRYAGNKDTGFTQDDNRTDANKGMFAGKTETPEYTTEGRFPANIILECLCDEVIKGEKGEPYMYVDKEYNNKELQGDRQIDFLKGSKAEAPNNYNDKGDIHTNSMCPCYMLDEQSGNLKSTGAVRKKDTETEPSNIDRKHKTGENSNPYTGQSGGASRFFYQAKVSKQERNMGLDGFEEVKIKTNISGLDDKPREDGSIRETPSRKNTHPTVKPVSLMAYLCRLVTPPNGIVLDPFMGSGSTGIAAQLEGFRFCGMELDKDYFKIAEARIENFESYRKFLKK
jgi:DNA modification methylase